MAIVYVKDLCSPCVEKFNSWSKWNKDVHDGNYTTLFIIQGYDYESFISKVNQTYKNSSYYYYTMDYFFEYEENNTHIPTWILNTSMLIDRKRVIKIIGAPYVNSDMNKIYLSYFRIKD
ncbi:MAG: hypothetical protein PF444_06160 [Bacteroidales bacterium]|nr:hypothetical protein [Bacteroidales bacterium]